MCLASAVLWRSWCWKYLATLQLVGLRPSASFNPLTWHCSNGQLVRSASTRGMSKWYLSLFSETTITDCYLSIEKACDRAFKTACNQKGNEGPLWMWCSRRWRNWKGRNSSWTYILIGFPSSTAFLLLQAVKSISRDHSGTHPILFLFFFLIGWNKSTI